MFRILKHQAASVLNKNLTLNAAPSKKIPVAPQDPSSPTAPHRTPEAAGKLLLFRVPWIFWPLFFWRLFFGWCKTLKKCGVYWVTIWFGNVEPWNINQPERLTFIASGTVINPWKTWKIDECRIQTRRFFLHQPFEIRRKQFRLIWRIIIRLDLFCSRNAHSLNHSGLEEFHRVQDLPLLTQLRREFGYKIGCIMLRWPPGPIPSGCNRSSCWCWTASPLTVWVALTAWETIPWQTICF